MWERPPPRYAGDIESWARQLTAYLSERRGIREAVDPRPPLLPSKVADEVAATDGVLMFDPVTPGPVYSYNGVWTPIGGGPPGPAGPKGDPGDKGDTGDRGPNGGLATVGPTLPVSPADGDQHYLTIAPVGLYCYIDDGTSLQWVQANGGSDGIVATVGDTLPVSPVDGALHYLTVSPVGLFTYLDDGSSQQWVQI